MKILADVLFPAQCATCDTQIDADFGLCPICWAQTDFIVDHPCDVCGQPLLGEAQSGDLCDTCHEFARPWSQGRAVMRYGDNGRKLVLALKHGDRVELAKPAGDWIANAAAPLVTQDTLVVPVPLHWLRFLKRRYNQSDLLARQAAKTLGLDYGYDVLKRHSSTRCLDGMSAEQRRNTLGGSISLSARWREKITHRHVLLIDDVMTTGATLSECASVLLNAGAGHVDVAVLAGVARDW